MGMSKAQYLSKSGPYPYNIIQTWTRPRYFVGYGRHMEVFSSKTEPTVGSHGDRYTRCIGPFRNRYAAFWFVEHPYFVGTTAEIERAAKLDRGDA